MNKPKLVSWMILSLGAALLALLLINFTFTPQTGKAGAPVASSMQTDGDTGFWDDLSGDVLAPQTSVTVTLGLWRNLRPTESYLNGVSLLPDTYDVNCLDGDQKSKGWIVGSAGVILYYCNGVWDQIIIPESIPTDLYAVQAISPTLGVSVGAQGAVLVYLYDNVAADWVWTKSPIPVGNQILYGVAMVPNSSGYEGWAVGQKDASGRASLVYGTINPIPGSNPLTYQYNWQNVTANYPNLPPAYAYHAVDAIDTNSAWAVGWREDNTGVIIHWNGTAWDVQATTSGPLYGIYMESESLGWAVGAYGAIYRFDGAAWSQVPSPTTEVLTDIGVDPVTGEKWIVGYNGTFMEYLNGVWTMFTDLRTDRFDFRAVDFTSGHGWTVGANFDMGIGGQILEYYDNLWLAVTPPTDNNLNDVHVLSDNYAWAVGGADSDGGSLIYWDGRHWQRWFQDELEIPIADLYTVYLTSEDDGWAAGDPPAAGEPAVLLHWDGNRWAPYRYDAPINVRINAISMLDRDFGWSVAYNGNNSAYYNGMNKYWVGLASCGGTYYNLRSVSVVSNTLPLGDSWAVGRAWPDVNPRLDDLFLHYENCNERDAWVPVAEPNACPANPTPTPPPAPTPSPTPAPAGNTTNLYGIQMMPEDWGFAVGDYQSRASVYYYDGDEWETVDCHPSGALMPTRYYAVDIVEESGVAWFGGFYTDPYIGKVAYISYFDASGRQWAGVPVPWNGTNIYHRPVKSLDMSTDTMGWAVGDSETQYSVIYQYPYPNFTINSEPDARAVRPGSTATFEITAYSLGGFDTDVNLLWSGFPTGITGEVDPDIVQADQSASAVLTIASNTLERTYDIPLTGVATFRSGDNTMTVGRSTLLRVIVTDHPIYSVSPLSGPSGTIVTISGENFGADPGPGNRSTAQNHILLAGKQAPDANVLSWSPTAITVRVPDSSSLYPTGPVWGEVSVTTGGELSNRNLRFQLENEITDAAITQAGGQTVVTLTGTSFGNDPGPLFRSTYYEHVSINDEWIANTSVSAWSNHSITFSLPTGMTTGWVRVTSNGYESNPVYVNATPGTIFLPLVRK